MKNIKTALGLFFFVSNILFSAFSIPFSRSFFNTYPASATVSALNNSNQMMASCPSISGFLEGHGLTDFIKKQINLKSNLTIAQLRHSVKMIEVQRDIKLQFLKWEREQADQQKGRGAHWIQNDALRNHLTQYGWHYVEGLLAVVVGCCVYKLKNKKNKNN